MTGCRSPGSSSFVLAAARLRALQLDPGPRGNRQDGSYQERGRKQSASPATTRTTPGQIATPLDSRGPHGCGNADCGNGRWLRSSAGPDDTLMAELQDRILHSRGGTFLVTGFRGVGKLTLIMRSLDEIVARNAPSDLILPVTLSVARSTTTERLLFTIVRRVFETLSDSGALERLPPQTRHALLVAYMRTSLSFKETQSEARERSAAMDLSIGRGRRLRRSPTSQFPKFQCQPSGAILLQPKLRSLPTPRPMSNTT